MCTVNDYNNRQTADDKKYGLIRLLAAAASLKILE